ncbi:MAG TPA: ribonuclease HII [Candidatus Nanoarchaeia archaeon]|nr:ribonuclease HII [Candidatus Nanoarchaeia archaeon]
MAILCGIDEAGRGPVIGPLVIAGVAISEEKAAALVSIGVKDSKMLSPKQRERMFDQIYEIADKIEVHIIQPEEIDSAVESQNMNLNWLEADYTIKILNAILPDKAFIDCPSNNIMAYQNYLVAKLKKHIEMKVAHKADQTYPVASAASIIAKVTRDREIEILKQQIGEDFGSGYPSDPFTKAFIVKNHKKYPHLFRKSWETYKAVAGLQKQKRLGEYGKK